MRRDKDDLEKRAADAVDMAKKAGADDAWASASRSRSVTFQMRNGLLEEVKDSTSRGLSLRLFVDGRYSTHSTTDVRPDALRRLITEVVAMTRALQPDPHRRLPDPALFRGRPGDLALFDADVASLDRDQRIAWCQAMNARAAGKQAVIAAESGVEDGHDIVAAASSNGFAGTYASSWVGMWTSVTLEDGDRRPEDGDSAFVRHVAALPAPDALADQALARARARVGTAKGPTRQTTMVVDNRAAGSLVRRLLEPAWGGDVQQERSFWRTRLGTQALSTRLSVVDDPVQPRGLSSRPFDGEGIAARRLPLVTEGVLQNLYLDTYYASKLSMAPTTGSPSNRVVVPGARDRDAIVAAAGTGVYVTSWLGGNMDATTGDFSFGVRGHLIENGKLGAPVGEMNVTGNMVALFARLVEVGNDPWPYSSVQAPTLMFDGVHFSGA